MNQNDEGGAMDAIRSALARNAHCAPGLLTTRRVVETPHGVLSHDRDRELIALVAMDRGATGLLYWYGHVLRVNPVDPAKTPPWAAVLVQSLQLIDAPDVDTLFRRVEYTLSRIARYEPAYAQERDDLYALRPDFDGACAALVHMIDRFDPALRQDPIEDPYSGERWEQPEDWHLDLRIIDVYGLCSEVDENGVYPDYP